MVEPIIIADDLRKKEFINGILYILDIIAKRISWNPFVTE